jgi:iron(III) transport system permease protein
MLISTIDGPRRPVVRTRFRAWISRPIVYIPALILIPLIILPMIFLLYGTFQSAPPGQHGSWTGQNYAVLWTGGFPTLALNSLILVASSTAISLVVGGALALALTRWNVPAARFFDSVTLIPAYIPAFVGAIAWSFLLSPTSGYLNTVFKAVGLPVVNIYSWFGVIGVTSLYSIPLVYLYLRPALLSVDRSLEEAGRMLGAGQAKVTRTILFPLIRPAILSAALVVFVHTLSEFAVVGVLGVPAHINVISLTIVQLTTSGPVDPGRAAVLGVVLAAVSIFGLMVVVRGVGKNSFVTIGARHNADAPTNRSAASYLGLVLCIVYALVTVVLPVAVLVIGSLQPYLSTTFSSGWTFNNYVLMANYPGALTSIGNSLMLSVLAAVGCALFSLILAYIVVRRRGRLGIFVNFVSSAPLAVPHMVFAVALIWMWVGTPFGLYGTKWILLVAYIALLLPYSMRAAVTAFQQLDPVLEEAGRMSGASRARVATRIITPLVLPGVIAGGTIVLYHAMQEISASLILYSAGQPVIPVAIWGLVSNGQYAQLFALSVVYIAMIFALVAGVGWFGRRFARL